MDTLKPQTVDDYIAIASPHIKEYLEKLRSTILQVAPQAQEGISYQMPAYKLNGILVYFGGFTKHVSLFPGKEAIVIFKEELTGYKTSGGTIQFPLDQPIPVELITKIVKFRLEENLSKTNKKKK